jgi:hypothetical protein
MHLKCSEKREWGGKCEFREKFFHISFFAMIMNLARIFYLTGITVLHVVASSMVRILCWTLSIVWGVPDGRNVSETQSVSIILFKLKGANVPKH